MESIQTDEGALSVALALYIMTKSDHDAKLCIMIANEYAEELDAASVKRAQSAGMDMVLDALIDSSYQKDRPNNSLRI